MEITYHARVVAADGELGRVTDTIRDPRTQAVTHLIAEQDGVTRLIPISAIAEVSEDVVRLHGSRAQFDVREDEALSADRTIELREERLVPRRELRTVGEVSIRSEVEEIPGHLEVDAYREEVEIEHVPIGREVNERQGPREEDGVVIVPVYAEELVVVKRLVLREELRIRRIGTTEKRLFEDRLRRERLIVDDPANTGLVRERHPSTTVDTKKDEHEAQSSEGGLVDKVMRRVLA
jgi:uncharacterized protein (TIGR02271 family)